MGKLTIAVMTVCCIFWLSPAFAGEKETIAWKDGWMAYAIDSMAVNSYHRCCDDLDDDSDPLATTQCWEKSKADALQMEKQWDGLARKQKLAYPLTPFWKRNVGEPRRLTQGPKTSGASSPTITGNEGTVTINGGR